MVPFEQLIPSQQIAEISAGAPIVVHPDPFALYRLSLLIQATFRPLRNLPRHHRDMAREVQDHVTLSFMQFVRHGFHNATM